jgi:DNA-binding beta-propeller fold protein YncE
VLPAVGLAAGAGGLFTGRSRPGSQAMAATSQTAYVLNWDTGTLRAISPVTGQLGNPIKVGPGDELIHIPVLHRDVDRPAIVQNLIAPDGKTDYVVYLSGGENLMLRSVSLVTGLAGKPIPLGDAYGRRVAVTPDGATAYVAYFQIQRGHGSLWAGPGSVRPVSLATGRVGPPIVRGEGPPQITITPDGTTAYVSFPVSGTVTPVSTATNTPGTPVRTEYTQGVVNIAPDGQTEYVTNGASTLVTPVSLVTGRAGKPISLNGAGEMAFTPDGQTAYYVNVIHPEITPVSTATDTAGQPIKLGSFVLSIVMSPDGTFAYAWTNGGSPQTVIPISTATGTPGQPIQVQGQSIDVVVPGQPA